MDRREFGLLSLGTAAATTGVPAMLAPARAEETALPRSIAQLPADFRSLMAQSFAKFSNAEYARRESLLAQVMEEAKVDHVLLVTWLRVGNSTEWITGWPGWIEAITVFKPGERMTMFVEYFNHIPLAQRMVRNCDVQWSEDRGTGKAIEELKRRGAKRVGVIGPLIVARYRQLEAAFPTVGLDREYTNLRIYEKSDEEIAWYRIGCALSDAAFGPLLKEAEPGMTENEHSIWSSAATSLMGVRTLFISSALHRWRPPTCTCRFNSIHNEGSLQVTWCSANCRRHFGDIPGRCCVHSQWRRSRRNFIAIYTLLQRLF